MKGIKIITWAMMGVAVIGAATTASAAMPLPYGWYLEGNLGPSRVSGVNYGTNTTTSAGKGVGENINVGYKFQPFFAGEVGYTNYSNQNINNTAGLKGAVAKHYSLDMAGKGILPVSNSGVELFAKLGASYIASDVSITAPTVASSFTGIQTGKNNQIGYYMGAGADYSICPNIPIIAQWQRAIGNSRAGDLDLYSIGIGYIFG